MFKNIFVSLKHFCFCIIIIYSAQIYAYSSLNFLLAPPSIGIPYYQYHPDLENLLLKLKNIKPYDTEHEMINEIARGTHKWIRVLANKDHVLHLMKIVVEESANKYPDRHFTLHNISGYNFTEIFIPQIGKNLSGLLILLRRNTSDFKVKTAIALLYAYIGLPHSNSQIKSYESTEEMLENVRTSTRNYWLRVLQNPDHVRYFFELLANKINTDNQTKGISDKINISELEVPHVRSIIIPEIKRNLRFMIQAYQNKHKIETFSKALQHLKENFLKIPHTPRSHPLIGKDPNWERVCAIFKNKGVTTANIHSFLEETRLTKKEERQLSIEMHKELNPAAREALVRASIKWTIPTINAAIRRTPRIDRQELTDMVEKDLYRVAWPFDPDKASFRTYFCGEPIRKLDMIIIDYLRKLQRRSRDEQKLKEHAANQQNNKTPSTQETIIAPISSEDLRTFLQRIYFPKNMGLKQRNIDIFLLYTNGIPAIKLAQKFNIELQPVYLIINKVKTCLKNFPSIFNERKLNVKNYYLYLSDKTLQELLERIYNPKQTKHKQRDIMIFLLNRNYSINHIHKILLQNKFNLKMKSILIITNKMKKILEEHFSDNEAEIQPLYFKGLDTEIITLFST